MTLGDGVEPRTKKKDESAGCVSSFCSSASCFSPPPAAAVGAFPLPRRKWSSISNRAAGRSRATRRSLRSCRRRAVARVRSPVRRAKSSFRSRRAATPRRSRLKIRSGTLFGGAEHRLHGCCQRRQQHRAYALRNPARTRCRIRGARRTRFAERRLAALRIGTAGLHRDRTGSRPFSWQTSPAPPSPSTRHPTPARPRPSAPAAGDLFVANSSGNTVSVYAPPYTDLPTTIIRTGVKGPFSLLLTP